MQISTITKFAVEKALSEETQAMYNKLARK